MSMRDGKRLKDWVEARSPAGRLWLFLGAVGVLLGGFSLIGGPSVPEPAASAAAGVTAAVSRPGAGTDAVPSAGSQTAAVPADGLGSLSEKPGASGKPVKTITVPRGVPTEASSPPGAAANSTAPSGSASGAEAGLASKSERVAEAPQPTAAPQETIAPAKPATADKPASAFKATATKMNIQDVKSPGGISAWLVEERSVPLLAIRFVFDGGSNQDPAGKEGLANFITAMMDEGAGDLEASQFQERMEELAVRITFEDAKDALYGNFETLTVNREPALDMLRLAINKPRFDASAVDRIRKQLLANLAFAAKNPQQVAGKAWNEGAFPGHPYGRHANGTPESLAAIQSADLEAFRKRTFARDTLKVVAVGDIVD